MSAFNPFRRLAVVVPLLVLFAVPASAQQLVTLAPKKQSGSVTGNAQTVVVDEARGMATVGIQVTGTFTGILTPQCSVDGTNYTAIPVAAIATPGTTATTISTADVFVGPIVGCSKVRVLSSSWMSGTAVVTLNTVQVSPGTSASATISGDVMVTAGAQPANDPHFVKCSDASVAAPCQVQGAAATDAAVSGNPLLAGGRASTATPSAVSADGDAVPLWLTRNGALNIADGGGTISIDDGGGSITVDGTVAATQSGTWNVTNISGTVSLPTGAATSAKQPALGTAGSASSDVITIQGVASMTPVLATLSGTNSVRMQDGSGNALTSNANGGSRAINVVVNDASGNAITAFSGSGGTASNFTSTFPSAGTAAGFNDGSNMQGARVFDLDSGAGTQYGLGVNLRRSASGGSAELLGQGTMAQSLPVVFASDQTALAASQSGTWNITNVSGTVSLPTGASTSAKQPALGTAGTASSDVITVQGIASMTPLSVSINQTGTANDIDATITNSTLAVTQSGSWSLAANQSVNVAQINGVTPLMGNGASGTGAQRVTLANDSTGVLASIGSISTSITPGTAAANLGKAEDSAHTTGDVGVMGLAVRQSTATDLSAGATNGDYEPLQVDANGRLWVNAFPSSPAAGTYIPVRPTDGSNFYQPVQSYTQDGALGTITSVTGPMTVGRASAAAPSNVSADDDAVSAWFLRNGSQVVNLAAGGTLVTSTGSSLNVNVTGGSVSGGTQYAEDAAHVSGDQTMFISGIRRDTTPSSSSGTAGDYSAFNLDGNGRLYTQAVLYNSSGTELTPSTDYTHDTALGTITSVTGPAAMCRASQAAPSNVSADDDAVLQWCLRNGSPVVNLASGGTLISSGNGAASSAVRVTLANDSTGIVSLTTSSATIGKLASNSGVTIGTVEINSLPGEVTEDAAFVEGSTLMQVSTVRRDAAASSAGTDGDNATINTDANGMVWMRTLDPCTALAPTTVPVSTTADAVLITATSGKRNYICGGMLNTPTAEIFNIWEGTTGGTCGSSSAAVIGSTTEANGPSFPDKGGFLIDRTIRGLSTNVDTCLRISGSNRVTGYITYVQAP